MPETSCTSRESWTATATRRLCDAIARAAGGRCAVFAGSDGAYQYAVIESGGDLRPSSRT